MADIFRLQGKVSLDTSDFHASVDKTITEGKKMETELDKQTNDIHDALQNAFSFSAGQLISDGLKSAAAFVKQIATESISLASDLAEVQNVVDVTFGDGASEIDRWAKAAKSAFGMSELKAKQYNGTMGAMLKSMGLSDSEVLSMSENIVGLTGDMASFYNLEHEEAFEKIRSGISGETEPLKALGINMSVANLEAYAMSKGITKAYDAMTQAEQAALRYNYLLQATSDAQGDFARTSDGYANQVRLFEENINAVKTQIGNSLVDLITPMLQSANDLLGNWTTGNQNDGIEQTKNDQLATADMKYRQADSLITSIEEMQQAQGDAAADTMDWNAALQALAQTMPELAQYIDLSTGKILVSTDALRENAKAVKDLAFFDAMSQSVDSYTQTVSDAESKAMNKLAEVWIKQSEVDTWQQKYADGLKSIARQAGLTEEAVDLWIKAGGTGRLIGMGAKEDDVKYLDAVAKSATQATTELAGLKTEYDDLNISVEVAKQNQETANLAFEDYKKQMESGELAQREYQDALEAEAQSLDKVSAAVSELTAYQEKAKASARGTVDSIIKGFREAPEAVETSVTDVMNALQNQMNYAVMYAANMREAQESGVDADLLASLSDGSEESAGVLSMLANASESEISKINEQFRSTEAAKDAMAGNMADAQLAVDESFKEMKDGVNDLIESFNQQDAARAAMLATGNGAIDALDATIASLRSRAMEINGIMGLAFGAFGGLTVGGGNDATTGGPYTVTSATNAKGLGYVPYDNYLSYLHKGEAVLSSAEAEGYRASRVSSPTIDYDRLASFVAAALAGATVKMDGQAVGELVAPAVSRSIEREARAGRYGG